MNANDLPPTPQKNSPSSGEIFVGLNILSKIGVIFIIIGVIAFSAVSDGYIPAWGRLTMIIALGGIMTLLGEVFRRNGSTVFAGSLTFGGIAELFICALVGQFGFGLIGDGVLIIGAVTALAGFLLSVRYNSQALVIVTMVGAFLPTWAAVSPVGYYISAAYFTAIHAAAAIIAQKKSYLPTQFTGISLAVIEGIFLYVRGNLLRITLHYDYKTSGDILTLFSNSIGIFAAVFIIMVCAMYGSGVVLKSASRCGGITAVDSTLLVLSQAFSMLFTIVFLGGNRTSGIIMLILAAIYAVCTLILARSLGRICRIEQIFENLLLTSLSLAIITLFPQMYSYMVFHVFAGAVIVIGLFQKRNLWLGWGYGALSFAELYFFATCVSNSDDPLFVWTFALNTAIWATIMVLFAVRGRRGALVNLYSFAVALNTGFFGIFLIYNNISKVFLTGGILPHGLTNISQELALYRDLLCAAVWMLLGFTAGKLKYMKNASVGLSLTMYSFGMMCIFAANVTSYWNNANDIQESVGAVIVYIVINVLSVLSALDMALRIKSVAPKFARAIGLVVSFYALMTLTVMLDVNNWAAFTSCIISIIYILTAAAWIGIGFAKYNALLRRFGLALALFSSAKLFLFDFPGIDAMGRTLMFIGFGITLLCISFAYAFFEKRLKNKSR